MNSNSSNLTFRELYNIARSMPTPVDKFFEDVCTVTHCPIATAKMWVYGAQIPSTKSLLALAKHFGIPPQQLFPQIIKRRRK